MSSPTVCRKSDVDFQGMAVSSQEGCFSDKWPWVVSGEEPLLKTNMNNQDSGNEW